jgi:hypothetical protein
MMNELLSALSAPGDYIRGVLAGRPGDRLGSRELLSSWGLADEHDNSFLANVRDVGAGILTDPLTYSGGLIASGLSRLGSGASGVSKLLPLRRQFAMAHGVEAGAPEAATILGGTARARETAGALAELMPPVLRERGAVGGFLPGEAAGVTLAERGMGTFGTRVGDRALDTVGRHEVMHGIIDQAVNHGNAAELPLLPRMAASTLRGSEAGTLRRGLGNALDELAAHAAEVPGPMGQARGAMGFLFGGDPASRAGYAAQFGRDSPLLGAIYGNLNYAPYAAAGTAAGYGGAHMALR